METCLPHQRQGRLRGKGTMKRLLVAVLFLVLAACGESNENLSASKPTGPASSGIQPESSTSTGHDKVASPSPGGRQGGVAKGPNTTSVLGETPDEPCPPGSSPILFFHEGKGYGFIDRAPQNNLYVHIAYVVGNQNLEAGQCVEYLIETDRRGKTQAVEVTPVSP